MFCFRSRRFAVSLFTLAFLTLGACGSSTPPDEETPTPTPTATPNPHTVVFTPVGEALEGALIDLEFLPGQNGESLAITKDGRVYYLDEHFARVGAAVSIDNVLNEGERGLLNVAADPDYAANGFVYFYYTVDGNAPDVNRVERYTVNVNVAAGTFSLSAPRTVIEFDKAQSVSPGSNHNGGALVFGVQRQLFIGVGDGGGASSANKVEELSQRYDVDLGKVHRIVPNTDDGGGYTIPAGQAVPPEFPDEGTPTTIYSTGLRNPFTIVVDEDADLFLGDVGEHTFEEINCVYFEHENYGWPHCEGPCLPPIPGFQDPIHGYAHTDETFNDEDPEENRVGGPQSVIVAAYYFGDAYGALLKGKLIYNDFYDGWVRLLTLNAADRVVDDRHLGHQENLTGLRENPADGRLYGTALGASNRILRMDLTGD